MGPKKKGTKKKAGKAGKGGSKGPTIIDGVPVSEMTKEQLEGHVRRLQEEVIKMFTCFLKAYITEIYVELYMYIYAQNFCKCIIVSPRKRRTKLLSVGKRSGSNILGSVIEATGRMPG